MLKETREIENKGQTARKELANFRRRSKPLERETWRISKETSEVEIKQQKARKGTTEFQKKDWGIWKETREIETREQTARKELESFRTRSKQLEGHSRISKQT